MKLRNKKTGEIESWDIGRYNSLKELCEEWEDYEKPKGYWFIAIDGTVLFHELELDNARNNIIKDENLTLIGNYFETREEAEKAVEKLKAVKRLKDNGFRFKGLEKRGRYINFYQGKSYETDKQCQQAMQDLDLLFGGEE